MIDIEQLNAEGKSEVIVPQADGTTLSFFIRRCHDLLSRDVATGPLEGSYHDQSK